MNKNINAYQKFNNDACKKLRGKTSKEIAGSAASGKTSSIIDTSDQISPATIWRYQFLNQGRREKNEWNQSIMAEDIMKYNMKLLAG